MRKLASFMGLMLLILTTSIFTSCKEPIPEPKVYTVTFDAAGGSEVAAIQVKSGEKAVQPEDPTKEGYVFDAWYNGEAVYDWETPVTADITLTAIWTDKTYTVTFDVEGIDAQEIKHKDKVTKPVAPTKEGSVFAGWYNGETAYDFELPVTSDLALTAKWDVAKYSITFDVEGVKAIEVEHGNVVTKPETDPTKNGYTFKGWMNGDAAYDWTKAVTANVELKASWEATKYTITYLPEGIETDNPKEYTIESEEITLKAPTKAPDAAKPNFLQWRVEKVDGDVVTKIEKGSTGNKTFYAEYTDKTTYKVTFMDGDEIVVDAFTVIEGEKVKLPTDYAKYDLYSDKECKTAFDATTAITANTTIYVKVKTFTVTFDSDGGSEVKAIPVNYGEVAKKPADPTKEGDVKFNGWYNGNTAYDWATKVTSNLTLKAQWKALETYTVTFDVASIAEQKVKEGQKATKPENPTKEGYTFVCWFVEGEKTDYDFSKAVTSNLKLKAAWERNIVPITLNVFDGITQGSYSVTISSLYYGTEVTQSVVTKALEAYKLPENEGYLFAGWEVKEKLPIVLKETITINVTAKWNKALAGIFEFDTEYNGWQEWSMIENKDGTATIAEPPLYLNVNVKEKGLKEKDTIKVEVKFASTEGLKQIGVQSACDGYTWHNINLNETNTYVVEFKIGANPTFDNDLLGFWFTPQDGDGALIGKKYSLYYESIKVTHIPYVPVEPAAVWEPVGKIVLSENKYTGGANYQANLMVLPADYQAKEGDVVQIKLKGVSNKDLDDLQVCLVDNGPNTGDGYSWVNISDNILIKDKIIANEPFELVANVPVNKTATAAGAEYCKIILQAGTWTEGDAEDRVITCDMPDELSLNVSSFGIGYGLKQSLNEDGSVTFTADADANGQAGIPLGGPQDLSSYKKIIIEYKAKGGLAIKLCPTANLWDNAHAVAYPGAVDEKTSYEASLEGVTDLEDWQGNKLGSINEVCSVMIGNNGDANNEFTIYSVKLVK